MIHKKLIGNSNRIHNLENVIDRDHSAKIIALFDEDENFNFGEMWLDFDDQAMLNRFYKLHKEVRGVKFGRRYETCMFFR